MTDQMTEPTGWGSWATAGLGAVVLVAFLGGQTAGVIVYLVVTKAIHPGVNIQALGDNAMNDGTLLSIATVLGALLGGGIATLFARAKAKDAAARYLGICGTTGRVYAICLGATAVFVAVADSTTHLLGRDIVPDFMAAGYASAGFKPLFWVAICLIGPAFEELFFRGFLITGWARSKLLGPLGAVLLSSAAWTAIHLQYGPYELFQVFLLGLMFGAMRTKTGSILPSFCCHVLTNVIATLEVAVLVNH